jgi:hypothetical protein
LFNRTAELLLVIAKQINPAARAAWTPKGAFSITRACDFFPSNLSIPSPKKDNKIGLID